ncbi:MAG: putative PEP-binding protein, partial [Eubacteriales bacterium]
ELRGSGLNSLCAVGRLHYYRRSLPTPFALPRAAEHDAALELSRLQVALGRASEETDLDCDERFIALAKEKIYEGADAQSALLFASGELAAALSGGGDPFLSRGAMHIRNALVNLMPFLSERNDASEEITAIFGDGRPVVLCAPGIRAEELAFIDESMLLGLVTDASSPISRVSLTSLSFGVPVLIGCRAGEIEKRRIYEGCPVIIDAKKGLLIPNPDGTEVREYAMRLGELSKPTKKAQKANSGENGSAIAEIYREAELDDAFLAGINGFVLRRDFIGGADIGISDLCSLYRHAAKAAGNGRAFIRLPGACGSGQGDAEKKRLYKELSAILRASPHGSFTVLVPRILSSDGAERAMGILNEAKNELREKNIPFDEHIEIGAVIETPSAALMCDEIAGVCDALLFDSAALARKLTDAYCESDIDISSINRTDCAVRRLLEYACERLKDSRCTVGMCGASVRGRDFDPSSVFSGRMGFFSALPLPMLKRNAFSGKL